MPRAAPPDERGYSDPAKHSERRRRPRGIARSYETTPADLRNLRPISPMDKRRDPCFGLQPTAHQHGELRCQPQRHSAAIAAFSACAPAAADNDLGRLGLALLDEIRPPTARLLTNTRGADPGCKR